MLLVSGDPRVSAQVTTALTGRVGLDVVEVATPQRALQQLDDEGPFDIVVADNDTHPTGGYYLAREVKARGQMGREVPPVVLLVAREQDAWLSDWAQADAWVCKPADPFDLTEAIDALVVGEPLPDLPGIGGNPKPSFLDRDAGTGEALEPGADPAALERGV